VGSFVSAGDALSSVIPEGELHIVADFLPHEALGRIRPGQHARMRLFGFPWTQYGTVAATVEHVAQELRKGRVRIELSMGEQQGRSPIPVQHGLPGSVEIEIEEASPASLVWRAVGQRFSAARDREAR
jgi:membrane fusion protein (multidrug efflux system)